MALLLIEGFEGYGTSTATNVSSYIVRRGWAWGYTTSSVPYLAAGRLGGFSLTDSSTGTNTTWKYTGLTTNATLIFGIAFYQTTAAVTSTFSFYDGTTLGVNVGIVTSTGVVTIKTGATTLGTYTLSLSINTWYYLEIKVLCDGSVGTVEVRVNGTSLIALTGQNTKAGTHSYHDGVMFTASSQSSQQRFDDIYICDGSGSTQNNFLGVCQVIGLSATADTATIQFTPSTGLTHYNLVNERLEDDDTSYVESPTIGLTDYYNYLSNVLTGVGSILAIQVNTTCKIAGTGCTLRSPISSNDVVANGTDNTVTSTSYACKHSISVVDPNTNAAWTIAGLNAASIGIKMI